MHKHIFEAMKFKKDSLLLLDQTKLPFEEVWLELSNADMIIEAIQNLRVRGAPAIGICGAFALYLSIYNDNKLLVDEISLKREANRIKGSRPTAINLSWGVDKVVDFVGKCINLNEIFDFVYSLYLQEIEINEKIAINGAKVLPEGSILTHCNTGSLAAPGIGTALGVIRKMFQMRKLNLVYVSETRPLLQGARLTVFELERDAIPYKLIVDSASGMLMRNFMVDAVIVGADRIAANGDTANKIGTFMHALAANFYNVPFYVAAPMSTIDFSIATGEEIPIEERDKAEVIRCMSSLTCKDDTSALNYAFDITPAKFIKAIITENGVYSPNEILTLLD
ncbi:Methylthioribose-1-phosphate isomerase [Thermodesulfobium narugense DSM 14796]|uniref:Methylthioribose-1-phosphate isomerase n=1 Tax=Thermodesulfobium narugense DSM 14796 TaxID=747365 RepID=M1E8F0_9BACT|nr:S-methyl-5-thioribose-1-phosphate isomerase [Thermodesulfobium narugense]AEE14439.1 Methylthioribose-1-phosphate isomerase [Thermodesulfobium narugense DSM 14796]